MNITKTAVDHLNAGVVWDDTLMGFGVRCQGRGKFYILKYRLGKRQRWMTIGRHGSPWTADKARTEAKRLIGLVAEGKDPAVERDQDKASATVKDMSDQYIAFVKERRKPTTHRVYKCLIDAFVTPALGKYQARDVTGGDVADLHDDMKDTPPQANLTVKILTAMYYWAGKRGLVPKGFNPCKGAVERYPEQSRERYLTAEEFKRLGVALNEHKTLFPYAVHAIALLALTGARKNEILKLKWAYVDLDNGVLRLPDSKTGPKTIYLNAAAIALLGAIPKVAENPHVIVGGNRHDYLKGIDKPWKTIRAAAELEGVRLHDLRHSFASTAVSGGMSLHVLGGLLGHKNPRTTQKYAHLQHAPMLNASDTVGTAIAAVMTPAQNNLHEAA